MTRLARVAIDAIDTNAHRIPRNTFAVGGYVSSRSSFRWQSDKWALFPDSYHIRINTFGEPDSGNCIDVENGAATPNDIIPWVKTRGPVCEDPLLIYCNRSNFGACVAARNAAHKDTGHYAFMWVATLDGTLTGNAMNQVIQIKDGGGIYGDLSVIFDERLLAAMDSRIGKQLYWNPEYMEQWEPRWSHEYLQLQ